jgi:hypothetical protein
MKIRDLKPEEVVVGIVVRSLAPSKRLGKIVEIQKYKDDLAWIQWDGEEEPTSGFYGNDCECEVVSHPTKQT